MMKKDEISHRISKITDIHREMIRTIKRVKQLNKDESYHEGRKKKNKGKIKEPEWMYKDFGIFGLGRVGGTPCVVSSNRFCAPNSLQFQFPLA